MTVPDGYLGAEARIRSGPAAELVAAGYELELADAPLLHDGLTLADLAHLVALVECGAVLASDAAPLVRELLGLLDVPAAAFPYDPVYGDAYNSRERELERRLGRRDAGWAHLGRTRREAGRIAFRLALRTAVLDLHAAVAAFAGALTDRARAHAGTVWADMTYLQPAQPSSFGLYLLAFAEEAARTLTRLAAAHAWVDESPAGLGGTGGTRVPVDRRRLAELLGFGAVGGNARDAMWAVDWLGDVCHAAVQATLTASRLAEDLEAFASPAFGLVTLDASLCRASVLLPQKRNPYALPVIRGGAGTLIGRLTGVLATSRTPSARTDNWLYAYGEVTSAVALSARLNRLAGRVVDTLGVERERMAENAGRHFTCAADLAEEIVLRHRLDYRTAYRVVGKAVGHAYDEGVATLTAEALEDAAVELTGERIGLDPAVLAAVSDPRQVVHSRTAPGGAAPEAVRTRAAELSDTLTEAERWRAERHAAAATARSRLLSRARELL